MSNRDDKGRFVKGCSGNPNGRKPRAAEDRYLEIIREAVTPADIHKAWKRVADKAGKGDMAAAKLLFSYIHGKPEQAVELRQSGSLDITVNYVGDNN